MIIILVSVLTSEYYYEIYALQIILLLLLVARLDPKEADYVESSKEVDTNKS